MAKKVISVPLKLAIVTVWTLFIILILIRLQESEIISNVRSQSSETTSSLPPPQAQSTPQPSTEALVLRAQLETMRQFEQNLISTVHWALGLIVTVLIAIVAAGWYANFKVYQRDIDSLKNEMRNLLTEESRKSGELLKEAQEKQYQAHTRITERHLGQLERQVKWIEYELAELVAKRWESENVIINAITQHLRRLELALQFQNDWGIRDSLLHMNRLLELRKAERRTGFLFAVMAQSQPLVDPETSMRIVKVLDSLPPMYAMDAEKVYSHLGVFRTKPFSSIRPLKLTIPPRVEPISASQVSSPKTNVEDEKEDTDRPKFE